MEGKLINTPPAGFFSPPPPPTVLDSPTDATVSPQVTQHVTSLGSELRFVKFNRQACRANLLQAADNHSS